MRFSYWVWVLLLGVWCSCSAARSQELLPFPEPEVDVVGNPCEGGEGAAGIWAPRPKQIHIWGDANYLLWWTRNPNLPILVTNGGTTDQPTGALGQEGTSVAYGGTNVDFREKHGGRFAVGVDLGGVGFDVGYFFLDARTTGFGQASGGNPVIARPFFNVSENANDSAVISYPGVAQGSIQVASRSFFQGGEANGAIGLWNEGKTRLSLLGGFRYLDLDESLHIDETDVILDPAFGTGSSVTDVFATRNRFYGAQIGVRGATQVRRWTLEVLAKFAVGLTQENVNIHGSTIQDNQLTNAGLLALASNSGTFGREVFAVVPEVRINVGFRVTDWLQARIGYSFLYWSRVVRPGDQIDPGLNQNLIPTSTTFGVPGGPSRPALLFRDTNFWAQGLNLGLEVRY